MVKLQNVKLTVFIFREGDKYIAYTPALDLSTCGDSSEQAKRRFEEIVKIVQEFFPLISFLQRASAASSDRNLGGIRSALIPDLSRAEAVAGPMAQILARHIALISSPFIKSLATKRSTPFVLVKTIQS